LADVARRREEDEPNLGLKAPGGVASQERLPQLAAAPPTVEQPSEIPSLATGELVGFDEALGNASTGQLPLNIGTGAGEIHPANLKASGGIEGVVAEQRPKIDSIRWFKDLTDNLLGKPSGSQEAAILDPPKEMSRFQKSSLWFADFVAMSEGRVRPSDQLDLQRVRAFDLRDYQRQQMTIKGFGMMNDVTEQLAKVRNPEQRFEIAKLFVPSLEELSPGLGTTALLLAAQPDAGDAVAHLYQNEAFWKGSRAEKLMNVIAAVSPWNSDLANEYFELGINGKIWEDSFDDQSPAIIAARLPEMIESGRRSSDPKMVKLSNTIASKGETTPEDVGFWLNNQAVNHNVGTGVINSYLRSSENHRRTFNTVSIERMRKLEENETEGPLETLIRKNRTTGEWESVGVRRNSKETNDRLAAGWLPLELSHATTETDVDLFGTPTPAMKTSLQEELMGIRQNADELIGIEEGFDLSLMTKGSKIQAWTISQMTAFTGKIDDEDLAFMTDFLGNKTRMLTSLSALLNRLSGAAVSPQEFERLKGTRPSPDDTPIEAKIKMQTAIALNAFRIARANVFLNMGDQSVGRAFNLRREDVRTAVQTLIAERISEEMDKPGDRTQEHRHDEGIERAAKELGVRVVDFDTILGNDLTKTFRGELLE